MFLVHKYKMFEYFFNVKNKDMAHRQKFVVVSTVLSFLLILGLWVPFQVMRLRSMSEQGVVAENKNETVSPSPAVAGDTTAKTLPFLSGAEKYPTAAPTVSPDFEESAPLISEPSSELPEASPAVSDFPTL